MWTLTGLANESEDALAAWFFPWAWFDSGEDPGCTDPATSTNSRRSHAGRGSRSIAILSGSAGDRPDRTSARPGSAGRTSAPAAGWRA